MAPITIGFGVAMILLGGGFFVGSKPRSAISLVPAFIGVVFVVLGVLGRQERWRKHAMHAAALLALIGSIATTLVDVAFGSGEERRGAVLEESLMAILCAVFVALCVRSFVAARRARAQRGETG